MPALGQKQTLRRPSLMSALPPKADIDRAHRGVWMSFFNEGRRTPESFLARPTK